MSDKGHELTDKKLKELENKLKEHYKQASDEVKKKLDDYLKAFKAKDAKHLADLQKNFTKENYEEYIRWRQGQVLISERWEEMRQSLAEDYHNANMIAKSIIKGYMPDIYALNHNYGTYDVEHKGLVDTSYTLYDRQTVERLMRDDPDMLPPPGRKVSKRIAEGKDILWNKGQIQSAMWQSVTQGESMEKIAHRLARTVGDKDMAAAIRNARTMTTGAECAGRVDSYKRAASMGIDLQQEWMATLDNRTRHSHRAMHGERIPVDGTFSNGCRFPGDPHGPAEEVYNCRCTLVSAIKGFEGDKVTYSPKLGDMSFEEWVGDKQKKPLTNGNKSGIIKIERERSISNDMKTDLQMHTAAGNRRSPLYVLTDSEIDYVKSEIKAIGADEKQFVFNSEITRGTCFLPSDGKVHIKGNVFPDLNSDHPRDRMSVRAVLAHEYYGHRPYRTQYLKEDNDTSPDALNRIMSRAWADEFRASYMAAKNAPNLTDEDRMLLIRDSITRAEEAGVTIKYNSFIRRVLYG